MQRRRGGSRQAELFPRSMRPVIALDGNHRLVQLTERLDWTELEALVESIRRSKLQSAAGRPPHLRALVGALIFRATRHMTYRDTEDQIRHYAPARYLCGLTETEWTPDANTMQDFEQLLGEDGIQRINEYAVKEAVSLGLCDPTVLSADTTVQEAAIPYPNEMGLMSTFLAAVCVASRRAGKTLAAFAQKIKPLWDKAKRKLREYRVFGKKKSKEARDKMVARMAGIVATVQGKLGRAIGQAKEQLHRYGKVARAKVARLHETMKKLLPQIRYWLSTGKVASRKIISLHIPELYSVVRNKVGKKVEFGLSWGMARLRGGFLLATMGRTRRELDDHKFVTAAVRDHVALFGKAPRAYAYDRGGYSGDNIASLKQAGVRHVAVAPTGRCSWTVEGRIKDQLVSERAQVEGGIGACKSRRYGFHRPQARSAAMMGVSGQRSVLGFNLNKLVRELAKREELALIG